MSFESDLVKEEMRKHPHSKSPLIRNIKKILKKKGWKFDSNEHSMAAKGIKTKMKNNPAIEFEKMLARSELNALSKLSLEQPLTDKQYERMMELRKVAGI